MSQHLLKWLTPSRLRLAIIWINDALVYWCICASFGLKLLKHHRMSMSFKRQLNMDVWNERKYYQKYHNSQCKIHTPSFSRIYSVRLHPIHYAIRTFFYIWPRLGGLVVTVAVEFRLEAIVVNVRDDRGLNMHRTKQYFEAVWNVSCCQHTVVHSVCLLQVQRKCHKKSIIDNP